MNKTILILITMAMASTALAREPLRFGNDSWPPFIITGKQQGTAEQLVCEALRRSGWSCTVEVKEWETVLNEVRVGVIDGVAAAWRTPERETFMLFSEPYLSNRIIPVVAAENPVTVASLADLSGLRVAMVSNYAYGDELEAAVPDFEQVGVKSSQRAMKAVLQGDADVALVDELVARDELYKSEMSGLRSLETVLAVRNLHLAVSRRHPLAQGIVDDFQRAYKIMLQDGTVNEILNVDWLATDFGQSGTMDVVLRSGSNLDTLANPSSSGSVFALETSEYQTMQSKGLENSRVNYKVEGKSYSSLQSALEGVFGKDTVCKHKNFTSQFDCTDLFRQR